MVLEVGPYVGIPLDFNERRRHWKNIFSYPPWPLQVSSDAIWLCNAPSSFQATMNKLFQPYLRKYIIVFFDDILIYSRTFSDHLLHLESAF